ncbi:uncharacterized protein [Primulina huaijiensis]|uniref:uncharacterized protein n=1 Tax=Primulina huaijiensis TaxID=1492673 RepID=UPI003CC77F7C
METNPENLIILLKVPGSLVVSGQLWTGPLHYATFLAEIWDLAEKWGWISNGTGKNLETLIKLMIDESDPLLPFGYIKLQEATSRAKANSPHLDMLLSTLHKVNMMLILMEDLMVELTRLKVHTTRGPSLVFRK